MKHLILSTLIWLICTISSAQVVDGRDKDLHFVYGAAITGTSYLFFKTGIKTKHAYLYALGTTLVISVAKELSDDHYDHSDILHGIKGGLLILPIAVWTY